MTRLFVLIIFVLLTGIILHTKGNENPRKTDNRSGQYRETSELVEKGDFAFNARRVYPRGGRSIDLSTNHAFIEISDSVATARLPFFGRAYQVPYSGRGGIQFSGRMENVKVSEDPDKMRINYSFEVRDYDTYRVNMVIGYNGNTSVDINSNYRSSVSYRGMLSPSR